MSDKRKNSSFKGFYRLLGYTKAHKYLLILALILTVVSVVSDVQLPKILGDATTLILTSFNASGQTSIDWAGLLDIAKLLIALYVIASIVNFASKWILSRISADIIYTLQKKIKDKLTHVSVRYYDENATGELISRATTDIETIDNNFSQVMGQFLTSAGLVIGIIVMMFSINPLLAILGILGIPISTFVISRMTKRSGKLFGEQQAKLGNINAFIEEHFSGHEIIKSFNREEISFAEFKDINESLYGSAWRAQFIAGLMFPLSRLINNLVYVFIAVIGGLFVSAGSLTIGGIQAILQYTNQLSRPMGDVSNMVGLIQSMNAACERVFDLLDTAEMEDESHKPALPDVKGQVDFDHVTFGYNPETPLMKDLNIHVAAGQTVAIVGPTGAGKTTVINLLMRFYDINGGAIKIDGHAIQDYTKQSLRDQVGMVLQDTWLFNGTIMENIRYSKPSASDEEVIRAAKQAFADDFIRKLPQGYDTIIKESSDNISQGQKQLLTIARAILASPAIFILDEATSNIDTRTEVEIQRAMDNIMANKTSFVIAHRLSTIRNADKILVMQHGNVIEQGTHDELLAADGFYAGLYNAQFDM